MAIIIHNERLIIMHRKQVLSLLNQYRQTIHFSPEEIGNLDVMYNFVMHEPDCFNEGSINGHITVSSFLLTSALDAVLLMHHKKIDNWELIGGEIDNEIGLLENAMKHARDESGIPGIEAICPTIFDVESHMTIESKNEPEHWHFDICFLLKAPNKRRFIADNENQVLRWIKLEELDKYTNDQAIIRMTDKVMLLLNAS